MKTALKFGLATIISSFLAIASFGQDPTPPPIIEDDDPEAVFTEEIKINVAAFDNFGDFVSGVTKKDVVISEDGRLHQPSSVRRIPANVLIMLDTGGELRRIKNISTTRDAASSLVSRLGKETEISILEYHDKARVITEWTNDREKIEKDLKNKLFFGKRSVFSDALELATAVLKNSRRENRHLVLISDGTDSIWSDERRSSVLLKLLETDITVHVISYTQMEIVDIAPRTKRARKGDGRKALPQEVIDTLPNGVRQVADAPRAGSVSLDKEMIKSFQNRVLALQNGEAYMSDLADSTNGIFLLPDSRDEMKEKTRIVAKAIDSNYVVTYTPRRSLRESKPGETRIIEVTSKTPGLIVQARRKLIVGEQVSP